jgi:hypothetical protein
MFQTLENLLFAEDVRKKISLLPESPKKTCSQHFVDQQGMLHTTPKVVYTFLTGSSVKWEHRSEKCKLEYEGCHQQLE